LCPLSQTDVYRLDSSLIAGVGSPTVSPPAIGLFTSYPNPFNPATTITYHLNRPGHVTLGVFDVLGREVITIVDKTQNAGGYSIVWEPHQNHLAAGIYFIRLTANNQSLIRKATYLR